ncbi:FkbM family methyltransferase [Pleurocapsa sp. FMAR1]|uniref:FkbM family methyltransferase n=1 Tax=Pleurocapsa sp. FMAR1 TaxID=3040204 RepID=UPI0029C7F824|nr:FkbM family methyltransferase [Pleurocapsa sp. FMAR1]
MYLQTNSFLRQNIPQIHSFLKKLTHSWRYSSTNTLPIPAIQGGKFLFLHPSFMNYDQCEPDLQSYLKSRLKPGNTFIDVGANFGFHTLLASKLVGRKGTVIAFEPSPSNLEILKYHSRINFTRNVFIIPKAVGDITDISVQFVLVDGGKHSSNSLTIADEVPHISASQKEIINVPITTIDENCSQLNIVPNVIKIDVEGAELLVLKGAKNTIEKHQPTILIGIHPFWMPKGQTAKDIITFFREIKYEIQDYSGKKHLDNLEFGDYIAVPTIS